MAPGRHFLPTRRSRRLHSRTFYRVPLPRPHRATFGGNGCRSRRHSKSRSSLCGKISHRAEPFPMSQVRPLPGSTYTDTRDWNRGNMERLAADRLLYTFPANAGRPVGAAKPLGGQEQPENGQRSSELRSFCRTFPFGERAPRGKRRYGCQRRTLRRGIGQVPAGARR